MSYKKIVEAHVAPHLFAKLVQYVQLIETSNQQINLTGFHGETLWNEGIYQSIIALEKVYQAAKMKTMLDIGAGAGFPSVPFLICHPQMRVEIYEPIQKRVLFLKRVKAELKLTNLVITRIRAEAATVENKFDLVTARAVVKLKSLIEISYNLAKTGGLFVFIKGPNLAHEIVAAQKIIKLFHINPQIVALETKDNKTVQLFTFSKNHQNIANYPRKWSVIIK